ncbi:MAG: hypothetical protein ABIJ47_09215 [Candidatus Bathyarchaeota archaeon]
MSVEILAIKFNHDPTSHTSDALNIRKNKTEFIDVPEWQRGICHLPTDSEAAYVIKETQGNTVTIQARFLASDIETAEIRAIDAITVPSEPKGCIGWLIAFIIAVYKAFFGNVLGDVKERSVNFASGDSGFVSFELKNTRIGNYGVGVRVTKWRWQYRPPGGSWKDFDTTTHQIYVLLEEPNDPWQQQPYSSSNDQLPWTEVMYYACTWAMTAKDRDSAASKVTENVNNLGPSRIKYDTSWGATFYSVGDFKCTEFLDRIKGGPGLGEKVNCTDCATITSTFSNILGCDLWQSRMQWSFALNELISIGFNHWEAPFGGGFSYHEVAWKGACGVDDEVFDACLKVDGDSDPYNGAPHTALLPVNMKFGDCTGPLNYRRRLTTNDPNGCPKCDPAPSTKQRRVVI